MIVRNLTHLPEVTCASPAYLAEFGTPKTVDDLKDHRMVGFLSSRTGTTMPLEFQIGDRFEEVLLPTLVTANDADTVHHLTRAGFGIAQAPKYRFQKELEEGRLVEILPTAPPPATPLAAFYPQNRQLSPRVRVFLDWIADVFDTAAL